MAVSLLVTGCRMRNPAVTSLASKVKYPLPAVKYHCPPAAAEVYELVPPSRYNRMFSAMNARSLRKV